MKIISVKATPYALKKLPDYYVIQGVGVLELKKITAIAEAQYMGLHVHAINGSMDVPAAQYLDASKPEFHEPRRRKEG